MRGEDTQEIVNTYLDVRPLSERTQWSFFEDNCDTDPLADLSKHLNRSAGPSLRGSPVKAIESPLKPHYTRARGSPTKRYNPPPPKPPNPRSTAIDLHIDNHPRHDFDLDLASLADVEEFDEESMGLHAHQNYSYLPDTRYSHFISKSTSKLRQALLAEKRKTKHLNHSVVQLQSEISRLSRMEEEYERLKNKIKQLRAENEGLQSKMIADKKAYSEPMYIRENELLRQKLIKYKSLYDDLSKKKKSLSTSHDSEDHSIRPDAAAACPEPNVVKVHSKASQYHGLDVGGIDKDKSEDLKPMLLNLLATLHNLREEKKTRLHTENLNEGKSVGSADSAFEKLADDAFGTDNQAPSKSVEENRVILDLKSCNEDLRDDSNAPIKHVADVIEQIRNEIQNINITLRENQVSKPGSESHLACRSGIDKSVCSACSNAASRSSLNPKSSSTREDEDVNDATRNLMGRYNWNRTL